MIVDSLKVYGKINELNLACISCGSLDHFCDQCDLINYKPQPLKIITIFQESSKQKRKTFHCRKKKI